MRALALLPALPLMLRLMAAAHAPFAMACAVQPACVG